MKHLFTTYILKSAHLIFILSRLSFPLLYRLFVFPLSGSHVHVQAQHVFCGAGPGEGGNRDVLPRSHPLPLVLLALPHGLLSLRGGVQNLLQVRSKRLDGCAAVR